MNPIHWQVHTLQNEAVAAYEAIAEQEWPGYPPPPVDPKWWRTPFAWIVGADEQGEVVGGCHWIKRDIEVGEEKHTIAALGGVVMAPEHRGRSLGRGMIPFANQYVAQQGYDWAVLFTSPERRRFYNAAGYLELKGEIFVTKFDVRGRLESETVIMAAPLREAVTPLWPRWGHATVDVGHGTW